MAYRASLVLVRAVRILSERERNTRHANRPPTRFHLRHRHQRRCIDRDHLGNPSSPYRKSWLRSALGPAAALAAADARTASSSARRYFLSGVALTGTSRTAA